MSDKKNSKFDKILSDIKSVKIQGATNVCVAGIKAFLISPTKISAKKIIETRPTEPLLQNAIKFLLKSNDKEKSAKKFLKDLRESESKITLSGASLIKNNMKIYSHCHSSTVMNILKYAKKVQKKKFTVYTTEVEPLLQGRTTAKDLASSKIKVVITSDLALEQAMEECDIFLFGADAYTNSSVVNKIGTSTLCKIAKLHNVKPYSCGVSLKFTRKVKIEKREGREVWDARNKNITVINPAFDKTKYKYVSGIISEFGVLQQKQFTKLAKEKINSLC